MAKASDFEGKNPDELLFYFVDYSPEEAERIGYSNYSYWGCTVLQNFLKRKMAVFCAILFLSLVTFSFVALSIAKYDYATLEVNNALKFTKPNAEYWFGTDNIGRDYWCQVWFAAQTSIRQLALIVAVGESVLGIVHQGPGVGLCPQAGPLLHRAVQPDLQHPDHYCTMTLIALLVGTAF